MINVLLVEDEPPVMRMLEKLLTSHNKNFVVVGRAFNGKRALEILKTENVDVVFTDIKMPVMGGLELAGEIQRHYPGILTVIISGYQDFEFARTAIQYGVYDYLLKPLSRDTLGKLLDKLEVTVSINKKENRHKTLSDAITADTFGPDILQEGECIVLLVCAGAFPLTNNDALLPSRLFWDKNNLANIIRNILGTSDNVMVFNGKSVSEKVIVIENDNKFNRDIFLKQLFEMLNNSKDTAVTIVCTPQPVHIQKVSEMHRLLRTKLYTSVCLCRPAIIISDEIPAEPGKYIDTDALIDNIIRAANSGEPAKIQKSLAETFETLYNGHITQLETVSFLKKTASKIMAISDPFERKLTSISVDIEDALSNTTDFAHLAEDIASIFQNIKEKNDMSGEDKLPALIRNIEDYLCKNYTKTITNSVLAGEFGFVPSYISRLFKSYKGVSPGEYLTNYRINKAKQLIKENPELMVKEISNMVGISDQYYFSKLFKKETGKWPTEFK
ncbi:MAG: response regulator [Bacillota bacterium]|nr:response regulator [Bacillota bacterium]